MIGIVVAIRCGVYSVEVDGVIYQTSPRGLFRKNHQKIAVGDRVILDSESFIITDVLDRTSFIKRPCAANVDQMVLVFSMVEPEFSYYLACKYLTYAYSSGIDAYIVLSKIDRLKNDKELNEIINNFNKLGIKVYPISNKNQKGIEEVKNLFTDKISCLVGQTGVGKSSLINCIEPNFSREIGEYSKALGRGKHQTKEVVLLPFNKGYIADTPGFSSLELDLGKEEVSKFFPGMREASLKCYYSNCLHVSEPKCEVKKLVEEGNIPSIIYESYLQLLKEIELNGQNNYRSINLKRRLQPSFR